MLKVKVGFQKLTILEKRQLVAKIKQMMANNPNFPGAAAYLAALEAADTQLGGDFTTAEAARAESKRLTTIQHGAEVALDAAMTNFAGAIQLESGGDETKILSSGLEVQEAPTPAHIPDAPGNFSLSRNRQPGSIHGHFDAQPSVDSYLARTCIGPAPSGPWTINPAPFSKSSFDLTDIESGSHVWVQVMGHNAAGDSAWSNASDIYAP